MKVNKVLRGLATELRRDAMFHLATALDANARARLAIAASELACAAGLCVVSVIPDFVLRRLP